MDLRRYRMRQIVKAVNEAKKGIDKKRFVGQFCYASGLKSRAVNEMIKELIEGEIIQIKDKELHPF